MRRLLLGTALAACMGTAYAGDLDSLDMQRYAANDYSAKLFYRLDFGGARAPAQEMGLRLDNQLAESRGAPAAFQLAYDGNGSTSIKLHGMELRGPALAAGQSEGGFLGNLSLMQIIGLGVTALVAGVVISEGTKSSTTVTAGTTTSGSGA